MLLLHLSDLHFGNKNRFSGDKPADLGKAFHRALELARKDRKMPDTETISVVIVTGDISESGLPSEFKVAREFLASLASEMRLSHERLVFLPGNHDISWATCRKIRAACAGEDFPSAELGDRLASEKLTNYREFLAQFYAAPVTDQCLASLANCRPLKCGGWLRDFPDLRLSVAALNTSEREHDEEKGGFLSPEQAQALMTAWHEKDATSRLKIIAVHHNPIATTASNRDWTIDWLREKEKKAGALQAMSIDVFEHYRADLAGFQGSEHLPKIVKDVHAHLILHGHHHDQGDPISWHWDKDGSAPVLSVGSLGLRDDELPGDAPLSCQLLRFILPPESAHPRLHAIPLVYDGRFRLDGQVLAGAFRPEQRSRASYDQPLPLPIEWSSSEFLSTSAPDIKHPAPQPKHDPIPKPPALYAEPSYIGSHQFVGRQAQLETLSDWATAADSYPVLLFEAIGGTGKSMLTWEWTTKHAPKVREDWAGRFWYSFYEKGATMVDFCRRALAYMTGQPRAIFRERNTAELTEPLIHQLQADPWLLILDGLERVLVSYHRFDAAQVRDEEAGASDRIAHRDPCTAINPEDDDLLRTFAGARPSKLLLTSRLIPRVLLNKSNQPIPGVLREHLPGLRPADAESLIRTCGVTATSLKIQNYLKSHCDCHPLVIGVLAGFINDYLPDKGNFDAWAVDPVGGGQLNLANLDLVQKRNHILNAALAALPETSRQLLSTLALLSESVDYPTLCALNPNLPAIPEVVHRPKDPARGAKWRKMSEDQKAKVCEEYREAVRRREEYERALAKREEEMRAISQELAATVKDLERRGLLQYDAVAKRHDLHPVVRGISAGGLKHEEKNLYGQRVVDHFSQQAQDPYDQAESLEDFGNARHIVKVLFQMGKLDQARHFVLNNTFIKVLSQRFEAHNEILTIIRPFFPAGWTEMPIYLEKKGGISLAKRAAVALRRIGAFQDAFDVSEMALRVVLEQNVEGSLCSQLLNIASTAGEQNRLALEDRLLCLASDVASAQEFENDLINFRLARFRQLSRTGRWSEALSIWSHLTRSKLFPDARGVAAHHYALHLFFSDKLTEEELAKAEKVNRSTESALGNRNLCALRGFWRLEHKHWEFAKVSLHNAVALAHKVGKSDRRAEIRLAVAKHYLKELPEPSQVAEQFANSLEEPCHRALADLWFAIGNHEQAEHHAVAAYKWAWGNGEPYVQRYELNKARALLEQLGAEIPNLPAYDQAKDGKLPWEIEVAVAIQKLRAQKGAEKPGLSIAKPRGGRV